GLTKTGFRLARPMLRLEDDPKVVVGLGDIGRQAEGACVMIGRIDEVISPLGDHPEEEPGLGALRFGLQDPPVRLFCPQEIARLEMLPGQPESPAGGPQGYSGSRGVDDETAVLT